MNSLLPKPRKPVGVPMLATVSIAAIGVLAGCLGDYTGLIGGGGAGDFLATGRTLSTFTAIQVDPRSEDSAGPQFVAADDLNGDGITDLVSAWNQSQPVQVHLQHQSGSGVISFETITLAGSIPAVAVAGLAVADFDEDGRSDIAVMIKESLLEGAGCLDSEQPQGGLRGVIVLYLGPADPTQANQALAWEEVQVEASFLQGEGDAGGAPEVGGLTSMAVGDMDLDGDMDIAVAWNSACGGGTRDAVVFTNHGPGAVRDGTWTGTRIPDPFPKNQSMIKDIALGDIDGDGDLDIVATFPIAQTMNVRWYRNPAVDIPDDYHITGGGWQVGNVSQIASGADIVSLGDIDRDGIVDVLMRSTNGGLIQWLKGPEGPTTSPLRSIPWQVYTLAEFTERSPEALALGDLNSDGQLEVVASASGGLAWFDSQAAPSVYDQWIEHLIIDDQAPGGSGNSLATTDPNVEPQEIAGTTLINSIVVVDLDGDGANDVIATLDRSGLSGLTNDALAWFRNTNP
ncbi:MAG: VCBS repeat-containing protein [Phycisphaerales bacterium]|nr:MAG: VCBS repeat-containing protein [Phycisphaerales bacterium]